MVASPRKIRNPPESFVATGGLSGEIIKSCNHKMTYDPELILKGLRIIYEKNRK